MRATAFLFLALAMQASAQSHEDAAHRADRLRTQRLNLRSPYGYGAQVAPGDDDATYQAALREYERRMADWQRRVSACDAGYYDACQR